MDPSGLEKKFALLSGRLPVPQKESFYFFSLLGVIPRISLFRSDPPAARPRFLHRISISGAWPPNIPMIVLRPVRQ